MSTHPQIVPLQTKEEAEAQAVPKKIKKKIIKPASTTANTTNAKPVENANAKPVENANAKPVENANAKPVENAKVNNVHVVVSTADEDIEEETHETPELQDIVRPARKTFSKYTIAFPSSACVSYLLDHFSTFYPLEIYYYINTVRYRLENHKSSTCICTFMSHLSREELAEILAKHDKKCIREQIYTLTHVPKSSKRSKAASEADEDDE